MRWWRTSNQQVNEVENDKCRAKKKNHKKKSTGRKNATVIFWVVSSVVSRFRLFQKSRKRLTTGFRGLARHHIPVYQVYVMPVFPAVQQINDPFCSVNWEIHGEKGRTNNKICGCCDVVVILKSPPVYIADRYASCWFILFKDVVRCMVDHHELFGETVK